MRLAIISDIHGNLFALEAAIQDLEAAGELDLIWCLGDLAAWGTRPAECVSRVRELQEKYGAEQIKLSIDGQELVYRMGKPTWESLIWPNPESISSARLEVRTRIGIYRPQQFDGAWGWFRLLDQAIIQKSTASDFNVEWRFPPDQNYEIQVKFKIRANSINNPFGQEHFFSISLPSSLSD